MEDQVTDEVTVSGKVANVNVRPLKTAEGSVCFFDLWLDRGGVERVVCFSAAFAEFGKLLKTNAVLKVTGRVRHNGDRRLSRPEREIHMVSAEVAS